MKASFWLSLFKEYERAYRKDHIPLYMVPVRFELDGREIEVTHRIEADDLITFKCSEKLTK
jgi:hypothetical protein